MSPLLDVLVGVSAIVTATVAASDARSARQDAAKAVRLLEGEAQHDGVRDRADDVEADVEEVATTADGGAGHPTRTDGGDS